MRTLTLNELERVTGGINARGLLGVMGGAIGGYYGAGAGASLAGPSALIGLTCALAAEGGIIWPGVGFSCALFAAGTLTGTLIGSLLGAGVGAMGGYITEKCMVSF